MVEIELRPVGGPGTRQMRVRLGGFLTCCHDLPDEAVGFRSPEACGESWASGQLTFEMKMAQMFLPWRSIS